jgi:hypothetical protein
MKKAKKIQYGIEIVKPWSKEMYNHNDAVAQVVYEMVLNMWEAAINEFQEDMGEEFMTDVDWSEAPDELKAIQKAVTCYGFGSGYDVAKVSSIVEQELEDAPLYRLNEIAEELKLDLKVGFVGFS